VFLLCFAGWAQQTPSFNLTVSGEKTWTIWLGLGAADLLAGENLTPGQPALTQTLRAVIEGKALDFITLKASFNDQLDVGFQDFLLTVDRTPWTGELGRFVVGTEGEGLGVYNKRVLGARVVYGGDGVSLSALVTRLEGISESRTFRGEQGQGEALFTVNDPDEPWRAAPYLRSVEGFAYWPLRVQFVEGLSKVWLQVDGTPALWSFLTDWGLGYLQPDLAAALVTPLAAGEYLVLRDGHDDLALRIAPSAVARRRIQEAIEAYNTRLGLVGNERKTYPFVEESDLETRFLASLAPFLAVRVDEDAYPLPNAQRQRYLALGERNVIEGTVEVWIRLPGETEFRPSTDPDLADYVWTLIPTDGVLRISFPSSFFAGGAVRATFAYQREGTAFALGPSLVPGSERVYLNGRRLTQGKDYTVDYMVGILLLFTSLGPDDELKVDFERQRGGLGVTTEYERNLFGLTVNVPGWDGFKLALYRAMDFGTPQPTTHTMPNTHTVAALALAGNIVGWTYNLSLAGSENIFPADDNARIPSPNQIHAIASAQASDGQYVIFAHQNGITVYKDGSFAGYGSAHGLAGRAAYALLPLTGQLLVGTDAGLTVVKLTEATPFDRVRSWTRITQNELLPGAEVLALARGGGLVYAATDKVLAWFGPTDTEDPKRWDTLPLPGTARPTSLLWADDLVYLGTSAGLYLLIAGAWIPVPEATDAVHDLLARGEEVYMASDRGILILKGGVGVGWVTYGKTVYALALRDGALWYAAEDGLWQEGEIAPAVTGPLTAVGTGQGAVVEQQLADIAGQLVAVAVAADVERLGDVQLGRVRAGATAAAAPVDQAVHRRAGADELHDVECVVPIGGLDEGWICRGIAVLENQVVLPRRVDVEPVGPVTPTDGRVVRVAAGLPDNQVHGGLIEAGEGRAQDVFAHEVIIAVETHARPAAKDVRVVLWHVRRVGLGHVEAAAGLVRPRGQGVAVRVAGQGVGLEGQPQAGGYRLGGGEGCKHRNGHDRDDRDDAERDSPNHTGDPDNRIPFLPSHVSLLLVCVSSIIFWPARRQAQRRLWSAAEWPSGEALCQPFARNPS